METRFHLSVFFLILPTLLLGQSCLNEERPHLQRGYVLEGERIYIGNLPKKHNQSVYGDVQIIRNAHTGDKILLTYFYELRETLCLDYEASYCTEWGEITTPKAGKVYLDFTRAYPLRGKQTESFTLSLRQEGERSTFIIFSEGRSRVKGSYTIEEIWAPEFGKSKAPIGLRFISTTFPRRPGIVMVH